MSQNPSVSVRGVGGNEHQLRDDLEALKADIAAIKGDVRNFARDAGAAARTGAGHAADQLRERGKAAYDTARAKGIEARDKVQGQIEDHPFAAVGIAFGVGLLIGAVISRRS